MNVASPPPILGALNPAHSAVVEACAGSGKTWLLASRILRLLLADVPPSDILAITFTRKAAREIEARILSWLHFLAHASPEALTPFLSERGLPQDTATQLKARTLFEKTRLAPLPLTVKTFHSWFLQLIQAAPLMSGLTGLRLVDADSTWFQEIWREFATHIKRSPTHPVTPFMVRFLAYAGAENAREMMREAFQRRSEWLMLGQGLHPKHSEIRDHVMRSLYEHLGLEGAPKIQEKLDDPNTKASFAEYLSLFEENSRQKKKSSPEADNKDQRLIDHFSQALASDHLVSHLDAITPLFFTQTGSLRQQKPTKALSERLGEARANRFIDLHETLGNLLIEYIASQRAQETFDLNEAAAWVFAALLEFIEAQRKKEREIDFSDAEWMVLTLLNDEESAAFLTAKLDARYRHVLLDEFQDTNPIQWRILQSWLGAYSDDERPKIFMVGDPKQSIYRFRRAEPKLFYEAERFFHTDYQAISYRQDSTWRNAPPIVELVNTLFTSTPQFTPFRAQSTFAEDLPGYIELLPLFERATPANAEEAGVALRLPLDTPKILAEDLRREEEAAALALKIKEIVGRDGQGGLPWEIRGETPEGRPLKRAARYDDILILVRARTHLAIYERALAAAHIPFEAASEGGLLKSLEAQDILALLQFLLMPHDNLKLAHLLRSPIFACDDDALIALSCFSLPEDTPAADAWWTRLQSLIHTEAASPRLCRAHTKLTHWLSLAEELPAHDLLDFIYHDGEVISRYRLAAPAPLISRVEANLKAFLLLALDIDEGRYPSLSRFVHRLETFLDGQSNDAPDAGEIPKTHAHQGRVRILTIHAAKGLEAPIVWLLNANSIGAQAKSWGLIVDWPPEAKAPEHFSFFGQRREAPPLQIALFEADNAAATREELNLLYVAITRAKQVLIASGISSTAKDSFYERIRCALVALNHNDEKSLAYGTPLATISLPKNTDTADTPVAKALPRVGERLAPLDDERRLGLLIHGLLERYPHMARQDTQDTWWRALGATEKDYDNALKTARHILNSPSMKRFFDPNAYVSASNELSIFTDDGRLLRIDRLVEFHDAIWVLDYKTGREDTLKNDDNMDQVKEYCRAVSAIFKEKPVFGALISRTGELFEII